MPLNERWGWDRAKAQKWLEPCLESDYLARRWQEKGFRTCLDHGCGPGRHAIFLARRGFRVTGFDQSETALDYLRQWAAQDGLAVETARGDMAALPLAEGGFDCAVCYNVIYHAAPAAMAQALAELGRVLRPGGELFITLLSKRAPAYENRPAGEGDTLWENGVPHTYLDYAELTALLADQWKFAVPPREIFAPGIEAPDKWNCHWFLVLERM